MRRQLRALEREVMNDRTTDPDSRWDDELLGVAQSLIGYAREDQATAAQKAMARIRELMAKRGSMAERSEKKVGLIGKLKQSFGKKKEAPEEAAQNAADSALYALEQKIEQISQKRGTEVEKLRGVIREAAAYDPDSYEYKSARMRAGAIKQQIKLYESQIDAHFKALMNNQRYSQLIENGLAMKELASLIPDPSEADAILERLNMDVDDLNDKQDIFDDVIRTYGSKVDAASGAMRYEDDEFDRAVSELRADSKQQAAEAAAPAAERRQAAEVRENPPEMPREQTSADGIEEEMENVDP